MHVFQPGIRIVLAHRPDSGGKYAQQQNGKASYRAHYHVQSVMPAWKFCLAEAMANPVPTPYKPSP
jgi:hypothetical protein